MPVQYANAVKPLFACNQSALHSRSVPDCTPLYVLEAVISPMSLCSSGATVKLEDGELLRARAIVGADGARSRVASSIGTPSPRYAGYTAYRSAAAAASLTTSVACKMKLAGVSSVCAKSCILVYSCCTVVNC